MTKIQKLTIFLILSACCFLLSNSVLAAVLYLEPNKGQYQAGDVFIVDIKIDAEGQCINTIETNLSFSQNILKANDFNQGQSIIIIWVKPPEIDQDSGLISFSGGIPGGYCGRISGDPGPSDLLGKIIFRVPGMTVGEPEEDLAEIKFLNSSQVLLNDGLGTKAKLTTQGAVFEIVEKLESPKDEWQEEIKKDDILPESFEIKIHQDASIFESKYFIIFQALDKQTGLDYYKIKEGEKDWKIGQSPYLLEDQTLQSIIKVKAVDKAGNERIAEYVPEIPEKAFPYWVIITIIGLIILGWIIKKLNINSSK